MFEKSNILSISLILLTTLGIFLYNYLPDLNQSKEEYKIYKPELAKELASASLAAYCHPD